MAFDLRFDPERVNAARNQQAAPEATKRTPSGAAGRGQNTSLYNSSQSGGQTMTMPSTTNWYKGNQPTLREAYAQIINVSQTDRARGKQAYDMLNALQQDPTSVYYNPYNSYTNRAVDSLRELGVNVDSINEDWYASNEWLKEYYVPTANGNSLSTSMTGKKASPEQKAAYYYNQLYMAEADTQKAEAEWAALQKELTYKATQTDRNWSDDEIYEAIDWKKYPTLAKMDKTRRQGTPMELNRAVGYSTDAIYGTLWAARNDGGTGNAARDMANSALGAGNTWHEDDTLKAKLTPGSSEYAPYSVGSTMDKEREFFGRSSFDSKWLADNAWMLSSGTEEQKKNYISVLEADEVTETAEEELAKLREKIDDKIDSIDGRDPAAVKKKLETLLNSGLFPTLVKMDKTQSRGYGIMNLTRAVDYRKEDLERYIDERCAELSGVDSDLDLAENIDRDSDGRTDVPEQTVSEPQETRNPLEDTEQEGPLPTPTETKNVDEYFETVMGGGGSPARTPGATPTPPPAETKAPTPTPTPALTEQQRAVYEQQDAALSDALDMTDGLLTPAEQEYMDAAGSMSMDYLSASMDAAKSKGVPGSKNIAIAQQKTIAKSHVNTVLGSVQTMYDYSRNEENLQMLRFRESELAAQLSGKEYIGVEPDDNPDYLIEDGGRTYRVGLQDYGEGYEVVWVDMITDTGDEFGAGPEEFRRIAASESAAGVIKEANEKAAAIREQNKAGVTLTAEEQEAQKELRSLRLQIEDGESYQREHEKEYRDAEAKFKADQEAIRRTALFSDALGANTTELEKAEACAAYLTQFADYEATAWNAYNPSSMYAQAIAAGEDKAAVLAAAKKGNDELTEELELAKTMKAYIQDADLEVPGDYLKNLDRHIAKLERDQKDYEYFSLSQRKDFEKVAQKGREMEYESRPITHGLLEWLVPNEQNNWDINQYYDYQQNGIYDQMGQFDDHGLKGLIGGLNSLMSEDELNTYYYLLGSGDEKAAQEYATFMADMTYGVLWTRKREQTEAEARGLTSSGVGGFLAGNALSVIMSPVAAISAMGGYAYNAITGSELNPDSGFLMASHFRNATREQSAQEILEGLGDKNEDGTYSENWKTKLAQAGYEIVSNRADSAMNALVFGGFFGEAAEGAGFAAKAGREFLSASPMGLAASMDAAAEAKRKGASDAQAYGVAAATMFAETATEAISLDNMREAFKMGEEVGSGTIKEFLKNWLTEAGVSEAFGESLNDIIENFADEKIMGELSEHADRVWQYRMEGMKPDEAEAAARRDELSGVLRTALISYMSPGLDIVSTGAGRLNYYRDLTRQHQEAGDNRSMLEIMKGTKKARRTLEKAGAVIDTQSQQELLAGYEIIDSAKSGSKAAQTAAVASALNGATTEKKGTVSKSIADAAAVGLGKIFGRRSVANNVQELVTGAAVGRVDYGQMTQALQNAALSEHSEAARVINSEEYRTATPDVKAKMLSETVKADAGNAEVTRDIMTAVREHRINEQTKRIMAQGGLNNVRAVVANAEKASENARDAESQYEDRQEETKAAQDGLRTAEAEFQKDPVNNMSMMAEATNKLNSTTAVEQEYAQKAQTGRRAERRAREEARQATEQRMAEIRQEAEANVAQQEAQEAEQARIDQQAAEAEAVVQQQAQLEQEAVENARDADAEDFIEQNYADATEEEKQHIRELFSKRSPAPQPETDRSKFLKAVAKKFNLADIVEVDGSQMRFGANGEYNPETNTITLNRDATVGDAMYFVLGHELTHVTEAAGEYNKMADAILQIAFGEGTTYQGVLNEMESGNASSPLARMVQARRNTYEQTTGKSYGNDYYLQEIVADNLGLMLRGDAENPQAQQDLINRLVRENPSTARKILDAIKNFIKRATGMRGAWQTDMQNTVDLFTQALESAQAVRAAGQTEQTGEGQVLTDRKGNETAAEEFRGGTVAVDPARLSLNSFNQAEQERTRAALLAVKDDQGNQLYTADQVDKYMEDALGIASMIAEDRPRLDFEATDNKLMSFLKKNQDYEFTLDASTLCAKRLLYQGTFNYVQHALPNEAFTPADLVELVNIMNEMGYEVPCGICYVESRRRWLDKYASEFLGKTLEKPEEFVAKVFKKSATAEEKKAIIERLKGDKPSIDDLTTTDGLENLRKTDPYMYRAFVAAMNAKGSANPKLVQPRTEYKGEISTITKQKIQKLKDIGGLRIQSFSDFETPHLLDMVQATYDMAARGLTSQAYTKVPNFAWVFGDTGIKINLSLIGKGTGVDDNGNLIFDNKEGMNFDEAMRLRDRYSKNVGTIIVGINDEHIVAAMGDPRIDFIIPFHQSGWSDIEMKGIKSLQYYKDYTNYQNERELFKDENGNYVKNEDGSYKTVPGKNSDITNFEPVGAHKYWEFNHSGEWNARKYLRMCAESGRVPKFSQFLVDNGDGSFSLPEGDDKRSTAIRTGYWKTLIDFKMYDNDGNGAEQKAVTPNINMDQARRVLNEYTLSRPSGNPDTKMVDMKSNNDVPVATTAGDEFIRRIKARRESEKPTPPNEPLEATPEINVMGLQQNQFAGDTAVPAQMGTAAAASGATAELGNTESQYQEAPAQAQQRMAIDSETGETVRESLTDVDTIEQENLRASLPSDAPYMAAVERGEMDQAQEMVDQAAREAGYDTEYLVWRGDSAPYNELEAGEGGGNLGSGLYFTPDRQYAERFASKNSPVRKFYLKTDNTFDYDAFTQDFNEYAMSWLEENDMEPRMSSVDEYTWSTIWDDFISENGYDSVKATGVGGLSYGAREISVQNSWQAKLADPVTYDDHGNVIPLSQRFNSENDGIRYQLPSDSILERQILEYLAGGGSLSRSTTPPGGNGLSTNLRTPGTRQRQFGSETAQRSNALHDEVKDYLRNNSDYNPDSNRAQIDRAIGWVQSHANENDQEGYFSAVAEVEPPDFDYRSADGQARMLTLMSMAALKGDTATELRLADAYNRQGTDLGQQLQARKIFQLMTPLGRQSVLQKEADRINERYKRQGKNTRVGLSKGTLEKAGKAKTPKDFDAVRKEAAKELAAQMPSNWKDKLTAWRMLSMLGNPRTHVRNILGNAIFMPAVGLKNKVGALTEIATGQKERTKTLGLASKEARAFAKADAAAMESVLRGEEKYKEGSSVERERKPFGNSFLQKLVDFNGNALEAEDWLFLKRHYQNSLAGYMTANKLTEAQMTGETLEKARAYAVAEAQKATYRDANRVIEGLNKWEASHPGVKFFGSAILPFKKTPANILKRGVEYSPVGLLNALTRGAKQVKMWTDYQNGKLEALPDKAISPTQFIDKIAAGLSGSAIMFLGAALANLGAVSAGFDDDDEFDKLKGKQEYALNLKLFGHDVSYTVDWAAPVCMPFFVGAAIANTYREGGEVTLPGVLNDLMGITEPVFNLSMLDGVNSLLDVNQYAEGNAITQIGEKILTNYATSFVPTAVGQVARTIDTTRRKSFVESGADMSTFRYAWEGLENKLPWVSTKNIPYRDVWGNPDTSGVAEAAIENFISPGYANQIKDDPVVNELERLYQETGDKNMIPKAAGKTISGTKLNAEQYDTYVVSRGQTARQVLEDLMNSPMWQVSDDPTRASMVADAWTYANQIGQNETIGKNLDKWVLEAKTNGSAVKSIVSRAADKNRSAYIKGYGLDMAMAIEDDDGEKFDLCLAALEDAGATQAEIRAPLRDYFKPLYQAAYMRDDTGTMEDIQDALISSGTGFKAKDFTSWIPGEEDEEDDNTAWLAGR